MVIALAGTALGVHYRRLHKLADDYYNWRNENYPVASSEAGLHTWDNRLTDYSAAKIAERAQHVRKLLDQVRAMKTERLYVPSHVSAEWEASC
jgi:recombinational DNA repair ATPase RecF